MNASGADARISHPFVRLIECLSSDFSTIATTQGLCILKNQAALITGSQRGIGLAIAQALAERGFDIVLHALELSQELKAASDQIEKAGVRVHAVTGDLADIAGIDGIVEQAEIAMGPLTTLVSNAGVGALRRCDLLETAMDSFDHCMTINAKAPFFLMQAFAKRLLDRKRDPNLSYSLLSISSVSAEAVSTNRLEYCMSKSAVAMMAKGFALRLAREDIQVFDIQPGIIETEMTRDVISQYNQRIESENLAPAGRVGQPQEIARLCAVAASGELPYMTGQTLRADGGLSITRI